MQREGAAYVAGCFEGVPGVFVFGGRSVRYVTVSTMNIRDIPRASPSIRSCSVARSMSSCVVCRENDAWQTLTHV
jgi:hypothetical protein